MSEKSGSRKPAPISKESDKAHTKKQYEALLKENQQLKELNAELEATIAEQAQLLKDARNDLSTMRQQLQLSIPRMR